uniref:Cytosol aminopeptidase domain-containing protein n=1 Tax=Parascaris univalens TaxID=6257 RepID=A0A914ZP49_PARUN
MRGLLKTFPAWIRKMSSFTVRAGLNVTDVLSVERQVLLVGKQKQLKALNFEDGLKSKLADCVSAKLWQQALSSLSAKSSSSVPLHLNLAKVISVPDEVSRHNSPSNAIAIFKEIKATSRPEGVKNVSVVLYSDINDVFASVAAISRCFPLYDRRSKVNCPLERVDVEVIVPGSQKLSDAEVNFLQALCDSIRTAARLIDTPCNELHTEAFADEAVAFVGKLSGVTSTIIKGQDLLKRGFGGIYHVGKAAAHPPIFACFSYKPSGATQTYALVGKGIVYDSGGMSIKSKTVMPGMKEDMGGAAGVLSSFYTLVKSGFSQNLHCLLCIAENSVSPEANRPDDVITMLSGKTVEINNTDAEGRLVLADGVFYAKSVLKATTIIDMATLTGAQGHVSGKHHAAILSNNEELERRACIAGRKSGDLVHPLPFCPDLHFADLKSPVADMRNANFGKTQGPLSAIAGLFISSHIDFGSDVDWLHVDMAYPVSDADRATGYGPALICALLADGLEMPILK